VIGICSRQDPVNSPFEPYDRDEEEEALPLEESATARAVMPDRPTNMASVATTSCVFMKISPKCGQR